MLVNLFFLRYFLFLGWNLEIWNILYQFLNVIHRIIDCLFFCGIHDLLHTSLKFFLQILCVKALRRHLHIFDLHRFRYDLSRF